MTTQPKTLNDVTLPTDTSAGGFDLDAWLDGAALPEKAVTVYGRADLVGEYEALDAELASLRAQTVESGMMNSPAGARSREIAERMTQVRDDLQRSRLVVRVRALTHDVAAELTRAADNLPEDEREDWIAEHWIAAAVIRPAMTVEQVQKLRARIGEGQFVLIWNAAYGVTNTKQVQVPFSLAHSATLATPAT